MGVLNPRQFADLGYRKWSKSATFEVWYLGGSFAFSGTGVSNTAINTLRALPFFSGEGGKVDRIATEVTTGGAAGSVLRIGIYTSTSDTNLYPAALVVDSGEFDTTTTGVKSATVDIQLLANRVYWTVFHSGVALHQGRNYAAGTLGAPGFGYPAALGSNSMRSGVTVNRTYGALPATFPASATDTAVGNPIWLRYAS